MWPLKYPYRRHRGTGPPVDFRPKYQRAAVVTVDLATKTLNLCAVPAAPLDRLAQNYLSGLALAATIIAWT